MNTNQKHTAGRLVVVLGSALSLACAAVIVHASPEALHATQADVEVVRLEPVAVTISADRFDAIRAEARPSLLARVFARKAAG